MSKIDDFYNYDECSILKKWEDPYAPKMSRKKKLKITVGAVMVIFLAVLLYRNCFAPRPYEGNITNFAFSDGSFNGGYYNYEAVRNADGTVTFCAKGGNGVDLDVDKTIDPACLDELAVLINEKGIYRWNGFNKSNNSILDGYSFSIAVVYDDGRTFHAYGYMKEPANYSYGQQAIRDFFEPLCE